MPTDICQFFYECNNCHALLKPKEGDCCVFCTYGTVPCPPIQEQRNHPSERASCCR
ncbi:MAG TPA: GDCCVxC domain-containing (seleno)protein [Acidithiobacillus sp.]|nr:GDCCVxC domain-containing (seleno)protein [Acidithiobacillus sp.]